ncbi:MAG: intradiol ring-cleavage dioxygenase, partial [Cyclobacteriaceae bacterium]|nr:intradiol ring-cleavage dioxygenase [Cyclobacteriaceae bacterium]
MEKREFLKKLSLGAFAFPLLTRCTTEAEPVTEGSTGSSPNSGDTASSCTLTNSETAGPYPTKNPSSLIRQDIRSDRSGVEMDVELTVFNKTTDCLPLEGALVNIWHCDKDGNYSEYGSFTSVSFLRGRQTTDANGKVAFTTIFPGWYTGRATHIHLHIFDQAGKSLLVSQIAFPEGSNSAKVLVNTT